MLEVSVHNIFYIDRTKIRLRLVRLWATEIHRLSVKVAKSILVSDMICLFYIGILSVFNYKSLYRINFSDSSILKLS